MTFYALAAALVLATYPAQVAAQGPVPLANQHFSYPNEVPYKVDTDASGRGPQAGYNICNSTTEGPASLCQTAFVNSIDDFCLWAPPSPDSNIGDTEGAEVAWCTKPGRGTRLIPQGALQGVQFIKTPDYVQVVGFINQQLININSADTGGELDPHGADLRGNPLGGLMYTNAFSPNNNTFQQANEWHNFMGNNQFCIKLCVANNAPSLCQHIYDRIGCAYNAPNGAKNGTFESCQGENQDPPGVYTVNGQVMTYRQPSDGLITVPYSPRIPASSDCVPYPSDQIYAALPTASGSFTNVDPTAVGSRFGANSGSDADASTGTASFGPTSLSTSGGVVSTPSNMVYPVGAVLIAVAFLS